MSSRIKPLQAAGDQSPAFDTIILIDLSFATDKQDPNIADVRRSKHTIYSTV